MVSDVDMPIVRSLFVVFLPRNIWPSGHPPRRLSNHENPGSESDVPRSLPFSYHSLDSGRGRQLDYRGGAMGTERMYGIIASKLRCFYEITISATL